MCLVHFLASKQSIHTTTSTTITTSVTTNTSITATSNAPTAITTNELPHFTKCKAGVGSPERREITAIPGSEQSVFFLLQSN